MFLSVVETIVGWPVCCGVDIAQCLFNLRHLVLNYLWWFLHDVTKVQTKELSIMLSFYFHEVLGQLKPNIYTNFHFKRVLRFVINNA